MHVTGQETVRAGPGGTPSPSNPEVPGRLLVLRCLACRGEYPWDYFADARLAPGRRGLVQVRRRGPDGRSTRGTGSGAASGREPNMGIRRTSGSGGSVSPGRGL